jgi:hypothetical protein
MSDSSDEEVLILAAICEEIEKKRKTKMKRIWTNDIPYKSEYKAAPNIRRPTIFPMKKSEKSFFF